MTSSPLWRECLSRLQGELSEREFNTWVRPLHVVDDGSALRLLAPNGYVLEWIRDHCMQHIDRIISNSDTDARRISLEVGQASVAAPPQGSADNAQKRSPDRPVSPPSANPDFSSNINPNYTFENFVEGKSNQIARAASLQISSNPGRAYNPLLIYGGTGLGKTHLMHAIGNAILSDRPGARVVYIPSERFVGGMIKALQHNAIDEFKRFYRSVDALLIDDIQLFAGKDRSQEELFHTFNALHESQQQVILSCDRYPKELEGLEERLKSRFGWGLTVAIEPPDIETRVAILQQKASQAGINLPETVAFFIAKRIRSHIRELEGALRRVMAISQFTGHPVTLDSAKEALRDFIAAQDKRVTVENIQKTVAEYYKMRISDLHSARRTRSITRPRQIAMALAKELTSHSLPEIGTSFGGRDHTTVLHACRKISELRESDPKISEDYINLLRTLSS